MDMERRKFLRYAGVAGVGVGLAACTSSAVDDGAEGSGDGGGASEDGQALQEEAAGESSLPEITGEMATSWPLGLDTIFGGAVVFCDRVRAMTGGRFDITPRAAGELVGGLEVLPSVEEGAVQFGHTASYYYTGRSNAVAFGTAVPFGLTYRQQNSWLYEGGGLEQMQQLYADRFGMIQFPAGNTGVQMGGWFNKEINSVDDLTGLTFRIPGLGGQVMSRLGTTVQVIAGGEIFQALDTGAIDGAEWVGPYDDEKLGFQNAASYYYYPGWWEPGPTLEVQMSLDTWDGLPSIYQEIVKTAAHEANTIMMARYDNLNAPALQRIQESGVELRPFPDDVMQAAKDASDELYSEFADADQDFADIYSGWQEFRGTVQDWFGVAEAAMTNFGSTGSTSG
jgi:TRAP-type mannitol/chloroaromatic compound transport system substrate-binding protein